MSPVEKEATGTSAPPQPAGTPPPVPAKATAATPGAATSELKPEDASAKLTGQPEQTSSSSDPTGGIKIDSISGGSKVKVTQEFRQIILDGSQPRVTLFSWQREEHEEIDQLDEIKSSSRFVRDEPFVLGVLATLRRHRLLLLTGEGDCGKASMARYLAGRLRADGGIKRNTLVYAPPGGDVRLQLASILSQEENLHQRVVIFRDALEYKNSYVVRFLVSMQGEAVTNLTHDLEQAQSYLILTAVSDSLPSECSAAMPAWLRSSLPPLSSDLLLKGIEGRISLFFEQNPDPALAGCEATTEQKLEIATRSNTISRAAKFIDSQFVHILRGKKSVADAFKEFDALSSWFQKSPHTNLEAWIYCLASVLADPLNSKEGVPWADFFTIYDAFRQWLLRHRRPTANERPFDEPELQAICGIESRRDRSYARDLVIFRDPNAVERHWRTLLTQFRSLATDLIPVLLQLTEHSSPFVRSRAAQALGRIGYLDAWAITKPWLETWSRSKSWQERSLVGYLAQGTLSAGDQEYRGFLLELLDRCARERSQIWAAVAAFKQIGAIDLSLGMNKLKEVAKSTLAPAFEAELKITQRLQQLDRQLAVPGIPRAEIIVLLDDFYVELFEDAEIAQTFKYALVSLSMTVGLSPVLAHLSHWALGSPGMGALVCFVFLQKEGIAEELTAREQLLVSQQGNGGPGKDLLCNLVLVSLIDAPEAVEGLAMFLEAMYAALLDFFRPDMAALLNSLLFDYCKTWVREALPIPSCRAAMVELIGRLLHSPLQGLWQRTYDWLASDPDFSQPEMAAFAKDARIVKRKEH